ncbi:MAG: Flp pilus assembly protein CpaB [Rhizobiaceae bacterium]|nr:Flp pilus assembly protein CpaB [Rhizobiaceae bacterium]
MKIARMAIFGVAVLAAGGAAIMASNLAKKPEVTKVVEKAEPKVELAQVLVAKGDISLGTRLNAEMVRWQKWPQEGIADGYIIKSDDITIDETVAGSIVRSAFFQGEPIRSGKLIKSDSGYMSAMLPSGQRAVSVSISTVTGAGGFILPNDRVDVIMTRRGKAGNSKGYITETILQNVRVLAIDQTIEEKDGESVVVGSTATLQLDPRQTEILTVAQQMADRLVLVLRSLEDTKDQSTENADYLVTGERENIGIVRVIRFGRVKTTKTGNGKKINETNSGTTNVETDSPAKNAEAGN